MFPTIQIGPFSFPGYGFMIGIGLALGLIFGYVRARRRNIPLEHVLDIALYGFIAAFVGAKLLHIIVNFQEFLENPIVIIASGGFVLYGGLILGLITICTYCKLKKIDFGYYMDLFIPTIPMGHAFGRLGCFMAGCCYGQQTDSWIGVIFPVNSLAPSGVPLIPTQLISAIGNLIIASILIALYGKLKYKGQIGALYLMLYGVCRFIIEFFRDDYRGAIGFLSTSQFISIFIIAISIGLFIFTKKKGEPPIMLNK